MFVHHYDLVCSHISFVWMLYFKVLCRRFMSVCLYIPLCLVHLFVNLFYLKKFSSSVIVFTFTNVTLVNILSTKVFHPTLFKSLLFVRLSLIVRLSLLSVYSLVWSPEILYLCHLLINNFELIVQSLSGLSLLFDVCRNKKKLGRWRYSNAGPFNC